MFHFHSAKSNELSEVFRNEGNELYKHGKFFEAMRCYNRSLCYGKMGSEHVALTYGNRSAVYLETQEFEKCLENIKLARDAGYPKDKLDRLSDRETLCKKTMSKHKQDLDNEKWTFFKLSYPPNDKLPFIANCLELSANKNFGRHIITNQDLKPGDIVALEETPFKALNRKGTYIRCANCFKSNKMSLIPSVNCAQVMFCSKECLEYGKGKYMCSTDEEFGIVPRILFQVLDHFNGDMEKIKCFIEDPELRKKTIFDFDMSQPDDPNFFLHQFIAFTSLQTDDESVRLNPLINNHPILARWTSKKDQEIAKRFMRFTTDIIGNALGYDWWELTKTGDMLRPKSSEKREIMIVGNGVFPFSSFFNHSCNHNVERFAVDNKLVICVRIPIKKGEQLFISYGANFELDNKEYRQMFLEESFNFRCKCEACKGNWPHSSKLKKTDQSFKPPGQTIASISSAKQELTENYLYISKNFKQFPNFEIARLLERNFYLLSAIGRVEPCLF